MNERAQRIEQLQRAEAQRRMLPSWLARFQEVTGIPLTSELLLSEDATSRVRRDLYTRVADKQGKHAINLPISDPADSYDVIHRATNTLGGQQLIVLHANDHILGAIQLNAATAIAAAAQIWIIASEDLRMVTPDGTSGFCLGVEFYSLAEEYVRDGIYELVGWGAFGEVDASGSR